MNDESNNEQSRRRSLESLRKEAKRWLNALLENVADARARFDKAIVNAPANPTLRDVQHALALEQGAPGWSALKEFLIAKGELSAETMQEYETMAVALLDAYRTGTPEAMQLHWHYTWHRRTWQAMRTYVQVDLGIPANPDVDITIDDARFLVAREHGFKSWAALEKDVATRRVEGLMLVKPMQVLTTESERDRPARSDLRAWNSVMRELSAANATGLHAFGQMTDALLEEVCRFGHISTLKLGGSKAVTDEGVRHLARLTGLCHLDLSGTAVTDRGLSALSELTALESISLAGTRVTDEGTPALAKCEQLRRVNLAHTLCGDGAIRTFAGKEELCQFDSGNAVTNAGLALFHEYPVFKVWRGVHPRDHVLNYDAEPNRLFLRGVFTDRGLASLRGLNGLFGLNLDDSALAVTGAGLAPLVDLPHLGWLAFDAKDDAMPYIAQMPHLRGLDCQDTTASDAGWVALGRSQSIERIWGRRCYGLGNGGFGALSRMPSLRSLAASCRNVDDAALSVFPEFPVLRELMPMDVPDAGYRHIAKCQHLMFLRLMYCRDTTDVATEHVARMTTLSEYFASYTQVTDRTPQLLAQVESLESITFDSCAGLTNAGIAALAVLPRLRELRVSGRNITESVVTAFPARVKVYHSL